MASTAAAGHVLRRGSAGSAGEERLGGEPRGSTSLARRAKTCPQRLVEPRRCIGRGKRVRR